MNIVHHVDNRPASGTSLSEPMMAYFTDAYVSQALMG